MADSKLVKETHETVIEMRAVLLGVDGAPGLCQKFDELANSHYKLKRNFYILITFLAASGVIGGAIIRW